MANFSFDIVSEVDLQEVDNAVNQAKKEMLNRYDFRGSKASIDYDRKEMKVVFIGDDEYKLKALKDMFATRLVKRGISLKSFVFGPEDKSFSGTIKQPADIAMGISKDKAKDLAKIIKDLGLKVQTQIEGEKLRVSSAKKDDLQAVIAHLKALDFSLPLNFCNYR